LLLGSNALIGQQENTGNRWTNAGGATTALHQGGFLLSDYSKFIVDANENAEYLPNLTDPFGWFQDVSDPATSYVCQTEIACPVPSLAYQGNLDRLIAKGEISGFANQDFSLWLAQKRLYERLSSEGNPYGSDTLFVSFLSTKENTSVGKFASLQLGIRDLFDISAGTLTTIDTTESSMADNLELLATVEQQFAATGLSSQDSAVLAIKRADLRNQIAQQDSTLNDHIAAIQSSRNSAAQTLLNQNANLGGTDSWEINEKSVNTIYLQTVAQGIDTLTAQQQSDLEAIAAMCPLADGEAVLRARGILALVSGEYGTYDDVVGCSNSQERNKEESLSAATRNEVRVYPNPANSELRVQYSLAEASTFSLYNAMGQLIEQQPLSGTSGTMVLHTSQ
ncbi:MAG: T9SS type A sorting domain-containing protein, partial [Anaerolineae bacterium]|nr:T9SS type A sorting domain-containing protein [Anaerolineae bacterium]